MKLLWLSYLVYSLGNYVIKLCIKTGLICLEVGYRAIVGHELLGCGPYTRDGKFENKKRVRALTMQTLS
jgi:hypothetical protein